MVLVVVVLLLLRRRHHHVGAFFNHLGLYLVHVINGIVILSTNTLLLNNAALFNRCTTIYIGFFRRRNALGLRRNKTAHPVLGTRFTNDNRFEN